MHREPRIAGLVEAGQKAKRNHVFDDSCHQRRPRLAKAACLAPVAEARPDCNPVRPPANRRTAARGVPGVDVVVVAGRGFVNASALT